MRRLIFPSALLILFGALLYTRYRPASRPDEGHSHPPGAHGGFLVPIGGDRYHVEAIFEAGGTLTLYTLGPDESRVIDVEEQTLTAHVKPAGTAEAVPMQLRPAPQPGDSPGRTSRFIGQLPAEMVGEALEITVPAIRINGERFRFALASANAGHVQGMPAGVPADEEQQLYLVPGGKYTAADIEANGRRTASQAFQRFRAQHDFNPRPGDHLCPVTRTKANPACAWIIDGRTYQFCCPPCVDEFVRLAKEEPDRLLAPEAYIKR